MFYSQNGQDKWLFENGFNYNGGSFMEIGAYDGITNSNSKFFEDSLGWKTILIEPNPNVIDKLKKNRPNSEIYHNVVSKENGIEKFIAAVGYCEQLSGINRSYNPEHKARLHSETIAHNGAILFFDMPSITIEDLFATGIPDVLSIDTEGAEQEIISSYSWERGPKIVIVENAYNEKYAEAFYSKYEQAIRIGSDIIFRRK